MTRERFLAIKTGYNIQETNKMLMKSGDIRVSHSSFYAIVFFGRVYLTHREEILLLHKPYFDNNKNTKEVSCLKLLWFSRIYRSKRSTYMLD